MPQEKKSSKPPKDKRRSMERRKEKSRNAARCRRGKETEIFTDLASVLPLPSSVSLNLDKASIIRIAIAYLKISTVVQSVSKDKCDSDALRKKTYMEIDSLMLKALEGFLLVMSSEGDITFISDNVNEYLGLSQVELLGQSIYEVSHPCDHTEINDMLSLKDVMEKKTFFLRMKCTMTSKGRNVNIKSASYKVIQYTGHMLSNTTDEKREVEAIKELKICNETEIKIENGDSKDEDKKKDTSKMGKKNNGCYFIALGEPIHHPNNMETSLGRDTFLTKHSLDMKFTYVDEKIVDFLGYQSSWLLQKSLFEYHHAQDSGAIKKAFKDLLEKGQSQTERYRLLALGGGYAWVVTQSTLIYSNKNNKAQSIICVNFVISGVENKDEIFSVCQLATSYTNEVQNSLTDNSESIEIAEILPRTKDKRKSPTATVEKISPSGTSVVKIENSENVSSSSSENTYPSIITPLKNKDSIEENSLIGKTNINSNTDSKADEKDRSGLESEEITEKKEKGRERIFRGPTAATSNVFVPFTEDMSKGFLTFDENDPQLTLLKDDADDLTHLAPTAGDACLPLDVCDMSDMQYIIPDMFDDVMLSNCDLLNVVSNRLDCRNTTSTLSSTTPSYFSYTDELRPSSRPLSPLLSQNGTEGTSSLSRNVDECTDTINSLLEFGLGSSTDDSDELSEHNSFMSAITMDDDALLPFVTANDLIWNNNNHNNNSSNHSSAWSSLSNSPKSNEQLLRNDNNENSSLAKLLKSIPSYHERKDNNQMISNEINTKTKERSTARGKNGQSYKATTYANKRCANGNNVKEYRRKNDHSLVGSKRGLENGGNNYNIIGGHGHHQQLHARSFKRSKQQPQATDCELLSSNANGGSMTCRNGNNSVLMNLLVSGCDLNAGYERGEDDGSGCKRKGVKRSLYLLDDDIISNNKGIPSLMDLTEQDYAVNAPSNGELLQGSELLKALDFVI